MADQDRLREEVAKLVEDAIQAVAVLDVPWEAARDDSTARIVALLAPALPVGGWRPIETAPKRAADDPHTTVLLSWTNSDGSRGVGEAYWHPNDPEGGGWWWENTSPGDYFSEPILCRITGQITHWIPLPEPPSTGEAG